MFKAGGILGWGANPPDTILTGDHPRTIVTKLGYN